MIPLTLQCLRWARAGHVLLYQRPAVREFVGDAEEGWAVLFELTLETTAPKKKGSRRRQRSATIEGSAFQMAAFFTRKVLARTEGGSTAVYSSHPFFCPLLKVTDAYAELLSPLVPFVSARDVRFMSKKSGGEEGFLGSDLEVVVPLGPTTIEIVYPDRVRAMSLRKGWALFFFKCAGFTSRFSWRISQSVDGVLVIGHFLMEDEGRPVFKRRRDDGSLGEI